MTNPDQHIFYGAEVEQHGVTTGISLSRVVHWTYDPDHGLLEIFFAGTEGPTLFTNETARVLASVLRHRCGALSLRVETNPTK